MLDLSQFDDPIEFQSELREAFQDAAFATAAVAKLGMVRIALERQDEQAEYDLMVAETPQAATFFAQMQNAESAGFNGALYN